MDQSDVITHLECWEKRAKKHDFRVSMAGEDSETSRHRAEELRQCIKELKMLAGIKEPAPPKQIEPIAKSETASGPKPVFGTTTDGKPKAAQTITASKSILTN
jgi:hypothetical protein